eukprot:gnl/Chilomastix_cuspidata/1469.p2 GENE.gnl/Chilomastix_cuspidata/1469~~gnl/Chilomastix_cuspidata/1469.p2  ORF type:complete len:388 (+),score=154.71 gnl/Chilomastix_cuspidata/1469:370-1533(+)
MAEAGPLSGTYFQILGVPEDCEDETLINQNYRKLALKYHPDRVRDPQKKEEATFIMSQINEAYDVLKNAESRHKYRHDLHNPDLGEGASLFDYKNVRVYRARSKVSPAGLTAPFRRWAKMLHLLPLAFSRYASAPKLVGEPMRVTVDMLHLSFGMRAVFTYEVLVNSSARPGELERLEGDREVTTEGLSFSFPLNLLQPEAFVETELVPSMTRAFTDKPKLVEKVLHHLEAVPCTLPGEAPGRVPPPEAAELDETDEMRDVHIPEAVQEYLAIQFSTSTWSAAGDARRRAIEELRADEAAHGHTVRSVSAHEIASARDITDISATIVRTQVICQPYKYRGKRYVFLCNTATGEAAGSRPYSVGKMMLLGVGGVIGGVALLVSAPFRK